MFVHSPAVGRLEVPPYDVDPGGLQAENSVTVRGDADQPVTRAHTPYPTGSPAGIAADPVSQPRPAAVTRRNRSSGDASGLIANCPLVEMARHGRGLDMATRPHSWPREQFILRIIPEVRQYPD